MSDSTEFHPGACFPLTIGGLTKREWFAGMALQGILVNGDFAAISKHESWQGREAAIAYSVADAMIEVGKEGS